MNVIMKKMKQLQKIKQIEYTDHYSVFDKTGKKICDVASIQDVMMMVSLGQGRTYKQVKILSDQVINVPSTKMPDDKQLKAQNILPERQAVPFTV
jgi:hypothetical protein